MTKAELISYLREIDKVFQTQEQAYNAMFKAQDALAQLRRRREVPPRVKSASANLAIVIICFFMIGLPGIIVIVDGPIIISQILQGSDLGELPLGRMAFYIFCVVVGVIAVKIISRFSLLCAEDRIEEIKKENAEQEEKEKLYGGQIRAEIQRAQDVVDACHNRIEVYKRQGILHEEYLHIGAVEYICECLEKGRADTLKEALNLYETFHYQLQQEMREDAFRAEQLENQRQILENQQAYQEGLAQLQQEVEQARREAAIDGFISAIGTDNAIRARKEIERANGKIV